MGKIVAITVGSLLREAMVQQEASVGWTAAVLGLDEDELVRILDDRGPVNIATASGFEFLFGVSAEALILLDARRRLRDLRAIRDKGLKNAHPSS